MYKYVDLFLICVFIFNIIHFSIFYIIIFSKYTLFQNILHKFIIFLPLNFYLKHTRIYFIIFDIVTSKPRRFSVNWKEWEGGEDVFSNCVSASSRSKRDRRRPVAVAPAFSYDTGDVLPPDGCVSDLPGRPLSQGIHHIVYL